MKILHLSCVAPPQTGGTGRVAFEIVRRLVERGEDAVLIAPELKQDLGEPDAPFVKRLPSRLRWGNAAALSELEPHLEAADIIHVHYPFYGTAEQAAQYAVWHRKPLVLTFHMDATAPFPLGAVFSVYRIFGQPAILKASSRVVVSSSDYATHSSLAGFMAKHPERVLELPLGIDPTFTPGPSEKMSFSISEHVRLIGFAGVMDHAHRFKGVIELLDALRGLPDDVHLLLVGEGDQRRIYEARAKEFGVADRAHFVGRLPHARLIAAYRSMDVFAFPSTNRAEAFGLVAAEAEACGIPVVASDLPGVRTVVHHEETGLLVPPGNVSLLRSALLRLLDDVSLRRTYGESAARLARIRFDWNWHVDGLLRVYREVTSSKGSYELRVASYEKEKKPVPTTRNS